MSRLLFVFTFVMAVQASALAQKTSENDAVLKTVNQFFAALEKQDTVLLKNILFKEGQSWYVRRENDSTKWGSRSFEISVKRWVNPQYVIHEKPLQGIEIKI